MLGVLGRRSVEAGISLFAVLGFCYVPLGGHTGFEHVKAVFSTKAAKHAGAELIDAMLRVRGKLTSEVQAFAGGGPNATPPVLPSPKRAGGSHPEHPRRAAP